MSLLGAHSPDYFDLRKLLPEFANCSALITGVSGELLAALSTGQLAHPESQPLRFLQNTDKDRESRYTTAVTTTANTTAF